MNQKTHQISANVEKLRGQLWPDVTPAMLWHRKRSDGFSTIPRTLSIIMVMMDSLSKGRPVSTTYLELWCRTFDEALLNLSGKEHEYATASGFSGERPEEGQRGSGFTFYPASFWSGLANASNPPNRSNPANPFIPPIARLCYTAFQNPVPPVPLCG
jgi:hypothetical protein